MNGPVGSGETGGSGGTGGSGTRTDPREEGFQDSLRRLWNTRPTRTDGNRKIAGVSAALGEHYGIDPVLFRVGFAVGTFYGGAGLLLYVLLWLALPKLDANTGRVRDHSPVLLVLAALVLVPVMFSMFDLPSVFGLLLGLLLLYLLHRHYSGRTPPDPRAGTTATPPEHTAASTNAASTNAASTNAAPTPGADGTASTWVYPGAETTTAHSAALPGETTPPAAASTPPPEQGPPSPTPPPVPESPRSHPAGSRSRHSVTLTTLGVALLAGGFSVALGLPPVKVGALMLGVLGCGMLVGAFLRGGRGLIALAIPLALLSMVASVLPDDPWNGISRVTATPDTAAELAPVYSESAGSITLYLNRMRLPPGEEARSSVRLGTGTTTVHLPRNADAHVTCSAEFGSVDCLGLHRSGRNPHVDNTDLGADGPGGGTIRLDLRTKAGTVEVFRG
ncbi:phage shock protein PspC (stress-responsive transcriptional regulator) [Actinopolyspora biskrensis]|uniref:Phage shock protein PspC (Stress-responsive transcriptional regulator) n=1 Tax=Actinopolyspora biskrensis TaxID=1470178 RepID=A0A852YWS9_9ACTN|nr:PspC domain-containing protein [Actinopolyspora biskrensis]NYH78480.1 phage shock protein PspC (stress-responsive transcriptional regulator) [Actinopolyspora biskrensis]